MSMSDSEKIYIRYGITQLAKILKELDGKSIYGVFFDEEKNELSFKAFETGCGCCGGPSERFLVEEMTE